MSAVEVVAALRSLADDHELLYDVPRRAIEDALIEWRDAQLTGWRPDRYYRHKDAA